MGVESLAPQNDHIDDLPSNRTCGKLAMLEVWSLSGKFGDPYSTKVPSSSVSKEVSHEMALGWLSSKGVVLPECRARFFIFFHSAWQAWHFRDILKAKTPVCVTGAGHADTLSSVWHTCHLWHVVKTLAGVGQNKRWFWKSFFRGKCSIWWTWTMFCGHDDDSVWFSTSDALGSIFMARAVLCRLSKKIEQKT